MVADTFRSSLTGPRILIYHQVGSGIDHEMSVTLEAFEAQIEWLVQTGSVVSLDEAVKRRGEPRAEDLYVLSFDDGYRDVYENAFPLMEERGLPFVLYLTSGPIEAPDDFANWPGEPLRWREVRTMMASGLMTLGAHTHTHPDLRLVDPVAAESEIDISNAIIEDRVGAFPYHFTYPKGWWAEAADPIVRLNYTTATLGMGEGITPESDLHKLNRVSVVGSDIPWVFRRKMATGGRTEGKLRRLRHGYRGP